MGGGWLRLDGETRGVASWRDAEGRLTLTVLLGLLPLRGVVLLESTRILLLLKRQLTVREDKNEEDYSRIRRQGTAASCMGSAVHRAGRMEACRAVVGPSSSVGVDMVHSVVA